MAETAGRRAKKRKRERSEEQLGKEAMRLHAEKQLLREEETQRLSRPC
jgi:hypothetical protein